MRIILDMQGAQTDGSRHRGIGRFTLGFSKAVVENRGSHEVFLLVNGRFPKTVSSLIEEFQELLPKENIIPFHLPPRIGGRFDVGDPLGEIPRELLKEFVTSLKPDVLHITSWFEGFQNPAEVPAISKNSEFITSVTLYDLIPLIRSEEYLFGNPHYEIFYRHRLSQLVKVDHLFAISKSARREWQSYHLAKTPQISIIRPGKSFRSKSPGKLDDQLSPHIRELVSLGNFVLANSGAEPRKNIRGLVQAYSMLTPEIRIRHPLVVTGWFPDVEMASLLRYSSSLGLRSKEIMFTGSLPDYELVALMKSCDVFIFPSLHEGFGLPVLEAMELGAATLCGLNSSLPEVQNHPSGLFDASDPFSMKSKLEEVLSNEELKESLRLHSKKRAQKFSWNQSAKRAIQIWEASVRNRDGSRVSASKESENDLEFNLRERTLSLIQAAGNDFDDEVLLEIAEATARNEESLMAIGPGKPVNFDERNHGAGYPARRQSLGLEDTWSQPNQLLLDVSELHQRDAGTGIQRVVREYTRLLLQSPPEGFRVRPVYANLGTTYRYADEWAQKYFQQEFEDPSSEEVRWSPGDVFFGLDMNHHIQLANRHWYREFRLTGGFLKFLIHDLLPIRFPEYFPDPHHGEVHAQWLQMILSLDGAICVSRATAKDFEEWLGEMGQNLPSGFDLDWIRLGSDPFETNAEVAPESSRVLAWKNLIEAEDTTNFLMVGTIEPRKGHSQVLDAVEALWKQGRNVSLTIAGRPGWGVDTLISRIESHPERERRLFLKLNPSDATLKTMYMSHSALLAASYGEGFGLPLVEAAQNGLAVIARDLDVFREVAGDGAFYFRAETGDQLASEMIQWISKFKQHVHPKPAEIKTITWEQSVEDLADKLLDRSRFQIV